MLLRARSTTQRLPTCLLASALMMASLALSPVLYCASGASLSIGYFRSQACAHQLRPTRCSGKHHPSWSHGAPTRLLSDSRRPSILESWADAFGCSHFSEEDLPMLGAAAAGGRPSLVGRMPQSIMEHQATGSDNAGNRAMSSLGEMQSSLLSHMGQDLVSNPPGFEASLGHRSSELGGVFSGAARNQSHWFSGSGPWIERDKVEGVVVPREVPGTPAFNDDDIGLNSFRIRHYDEESPVEQIGDVKYATAFMPCPSSREEEHKPQVALEFGEMEDDRREQGAAVRSRRPLGGLKHDLSADPTWSKRVLRSADNAHFDLQMPLDKEVFVCDICAEAIHDSTKIETLCGIKAHELCTPCATELVRRRPGHLARCPWCRRQQNIASRMRHHLLGNQPPPPGHGRGGVVEHLRLSDRLRLRRRRTQTSSATVRFDRAQLARPLAGLARSRGISIFHM